MQTEPPGYYLTDPAPPPDTWGNPPAAAAGSWLMSISQRERFANDEWRWIGIQQLSEILADLTGDTHPVNKADLLDRLKVAIAILENTA